MFKKSAPVLLLVSVMLAVSCAATAQDKGGGSKGGTSVVPTVAGGSGKVSIESLIQRYGQLAGSADNATSLINGLRSGSLVTLTLMVKEGGLCTVMVDDCLPSPIPGGACIKTGSQHPEQRPCVVDNEKRETFTPPTGNMGLGNVDIALALTEALLTQKAVSNPTPNQLQTALVGDSGILTLRAKGMGWGDLAKALGFTLK